MAPVLGYWKTRGLGQPIRLLLTYCGEDFEDKRYTTGEDWFSVKFSMGFGFPNLPYYIDGDKKVTQSNAILRYVGRKYNLCGLTEEEKITVDVSAEQVWDFRNGLLKVCYNPKGDIEAYKKTLPTTLKAFSDFLGSNDWLAGKNITFPDFHLYEVLDTHRILLPGSLDEYKTLQQYIQRFEALPAIKAYLASDKFIKGPFHGPMAILGNK